MKAKILINDVAGRFSAGEIGEVLPNDFSKYAYKIKLPALATTKCEEGLFKDLIMGDRIIYFYSNEIELLK